MNFLNVCNRIDINIYFSFSLLLQISSILNFLFRSVAPENLAWEALYISLFRVMASRKNQASIKSYFHYGKRGKSNDNLNLQFLALPFYCAFFSICLKELVFYWKKIHLKHLSLLKLVVLPLAKTQIASWKVLLPSLSELSKGIILV